MPIQNYRDWQRNNRDPFDENDQYKYGNYKYLKDNAKGEARLECNKCGVVHTVPYYRLQRKIVVRCKCGNR